MDEQAVRTRAESFCEALVAGDVDRAIGDFSSALRQNLGEVLTLFPLPSSAAEIDSVERSPTGFVVTLRLTGAGEEVLVQTRWKDRDGEPTIVEASHLSRTMVEEPAVVDEEADVAEAART
ncbi:MAG TPA: hypothetical protein VFC71_08595 [Candidatus Polarisedimenticolia bacterium]|nr:hypothetical protein [Candidatus Polarisedimenticolia bacterium]